MEGRCPTGGGNAILAAAVAGKALLEFLYILSMGGNPVALKAIKNIFKFLAAEERLTNWNHDASLLTIEGFLATIIATAFEEYHRA